jgi:hypothetical protein
MVSSGKPGGGADTGVQLIRTELPVTVAVA